MNKTMLFLIATPAVCLLGALAAGVTVVDWPGALIALVETIHKRRDFAAKATTYRCFKRTLESAQQSLANGNMRLRDACANVTSAAREFWPVYLIHLKTSEPGDSDEERVVHNLVGHVCELTQRFRLPAGRLTALNAELQELLCELRKRSAAGAAANEEPPMHVVP